MATKMCSHLRVIPSIWCLVQKPIRHVDNKESFCLTLDIYGCPSLP